MTTPDISPRALQQLLGSAIELALLDVREARQYVAGHLNLARLAPLSTLELEIAERVPRKTTPIILVDDGNPDGPAQRASSVLTRLGYQDIRILGGGTAAWDAEGLPLIDGFGTLVKAFGDRVRQHYATPTISGAEVRARQKSAQATSLIDARPQAEFEFLSLPGADNYPGTELSIRDFPAAAPGHLWAINCFSRTRGIIGATTLQIIGRKDVAFVEDGVMQWALERAPVVQNADVLDALPAAPDAVLQSRAAALVGRYGLSVINASDITRFRNESDRTLYVFDLRPATGGNALPERGVQHVAGGQLLMHFENLIGTRNARIVLIDDSHHLRAAITAFWLSQLNQAEVHILDGELPASHAHEESAAFDGSRDSNSVSANELAGLLTSQAPHIVDVGPSLDYERSHLPGAYFLLPSALDRLSRLLGTGSRIVFVSPDGAAARLAARDARERWPDERFSWLQNGTKDWESEGYPTEQSWEPYQLLGPFDDDWGSVMRVAGPRRDRAWVDYLVWERELSARVIKDSNVEFKFFDVPGI
jgi:rhodanese-related sulfurtransferase